jgi:hypothetical protein
MAIDQPKSERYSDTLLDGEQCMGQNKKSFLSKGSSRESGRNQMRTHMEDLGVTIAGQPFPHMVYHLVLTYSNAEAISLCFSETDRGPWLRGSRKRTGLLAGCQSNTARTI